MAGQQRSLDKISSSEKGKAGGVCPLGDNGKVPAKYVDAQSSGGVALDQNGYIPAQYIRQGTGSGLNAELLDGKPSSDFAGAATNIAVNYPLQGGGDLRSGRVVISLAEDVLNGNLDHTKLLNIGTNTHAAIDTHVASTSNPHTVTKAQVGLGNCDNTTDAEKPVSTAQQTALNGKISHSLATAANDVLVASGVGSFVKKTLVELKTILGLGTAAYTASTDYAVAAKGVTNGDSHDHSGGDGAQIAYSSLSGTPTVPVASSTTPAALGTAAVGTGTTFARADHVHTMPTAANVGAAPTAHAAAATTYGAGDETNYGHVQMGTATPASLGTAAKGTGTRAAHEDHVHPTTGLMLTTHAANSVTGFGTEPPAVSTSSSGTAGVATTVSRGDHGHDLGAHTHADAASGGTIAHTGLTAIGTNTHAAIDTFIGTKAAASGLASLNASSLVVQNPAEATATPTADKIPIASALGKLTAWIDAATTSVAGIAMLATNAIALAGTDAAKGITSAALWYVLTLATRLRISTNTTIYVSTTGSDTTGTGLVGAPFASIGKALSSIAGKSIDAGATVTIQVADGTYTISSTIAITHPDADKIQIFGNLSAETTVAITAIDTTAKTITVAGDYTASILVGDIIGLTGSSTSGLNGAYLVSGSTYSGGNTVVTCSSETIVSATVGGGSLLIKPCNRCVLSFSGTSTFLLKGKLDAIKGFKFSSTTALFGLQSQGNFSSVTVLNCIFYGFTYGIYASTTTNVSMSGVVLKGLTYGMYGIWNVSFVMVLPKTIIDSCSTLGIYVSKFGYAGITASNVIFRNCATNTSPVVNTPGNANSYID